MALPATPDAISKVTRVAFDTYWSFRGFVLVDPPQNDPAATDSLDLQMAERVDRIGGAAAARLAADFVSSSDLVLSPVAPATPAPGTVWINTSTI